jgi:hypothetical protein
VSHDGESTIPPKEKLIYCNNVALPVTSNLFCLLSRQLNGAVVQGLKNLHWSNLHAHSNSHKNELMHEVPDRLNVSMLYDVAVGRSVATIVLASEY